MQNFILLNLSRLIFNHPARIARAQMCRKFCSKEEKKMSNSAINHSVSRVKLEHARKFGTKLLFLSAFEYLSRAARIVKKNCSQCRSNDKIFYDT